MAVVRKKTDDKNLKILREIVSLGGNRQCFDCGQRGPTYINMTIGSFVCTKCSGMLCLGVTLACAKCRGGSNKLMTPAAGEKKQVQLVE
uniref:Uncharacterized protein n=1 Tax=Phlebotomus papatasi TaxID=29031 RepID=A0A1B0GNY0_PHLPP